MSYILEALKKSEQERSLGHVPELGSAQETLPTRSPRWPWILSGALLINALALTVFAWKPWHTAPSSAATETIPPPVPAQRIEPPSPVAELPARVPSAEQSRPEIREPAATAESAPVQREQQALAQSLQSDTPRAPDESMSPVPVIAETSAPRQDATVDAVPRWQDLSAEQRSRLPTPRMDVHVFAQDPSRRFVMIDMRKYQEGDRLPQGVTLEAIRAEGIILSYQGQQYRVERP